MFLLHYRVSTDQRRDALQPGGLLSVWRCQGVHRKMEADADDPDQSALLQFKEEATRSSVTVKPDGVDGGGDGAAPVAPPLLLRLLMAE